MPNRILRDGILTSERVDRLGWAEEVFYRRLHSVVDDHGRYHANPKLLRAALYPLRLDKVSDPDIGKWLTVCVEAALVRVYPAEDGKRYIQLLDFGQQVRSKSKFPEPIDINCAQPDINCEQVPAVAHLDVGVFGDGDVIGNAPAARKRAKKPDLTEIPEGFAISERVQTWAKEKGHTRLAEHLEHFVSACKAKRYQYADWDEAFMGAIRKDWARLTQQGAPQEQARVEQWGK